MMFFNGLIRRKSLLNLFQKYVRQEKIWDAHTVGKNLFSRKPSDKKVFNVYFSFCVDVSGNGEYNVDIQSFFHKEAEIALSLYCEKCRMTAQTIADVRIQRAKLEEAFASINTKIKNIQKSQEVKIVENNDTIINDLDALKQDFAGVSSQESFDVILNKVSELEKELKKDYLTSTQQEKYNAITREYSELVSNTMQKLSRKKDVEYNKQAVQSFKKGFDLFKDDERFYKNNKEALQRLATNYLFKYDASRLFSESLVYFNNVYSYIFGKLNDDGKFLLTRYSLDCSSIN